jgi:hypothetical protein
MPLREIPQIRFYDPGDAAHASKGFVAELERAGADHAFVEAVRAAVSSKAEVAVVGDDSAQLGKLGA